MHLVWTAGRVFLKPIPRFLLKPGFWTVYLVCADGRRQILRQRALGFLYSYAALLSHESDFRIAKDEYLLPPEVLWSARRILVEQLDMERVYPNVDRRFIHGELRLSRLNKLYSLYKTPLRGSIRVFNDAPQFTHFAIKHLAGWCAGKASLSDDGLARVTKLSPETAWNARDSLA
ncbi:hypothetical protein BM221_007205 [Beauveria bassiana]|uniref:Uncharacterized protein n=1 Tax=Beauveria bassiana TaxID=176275 RepID=A0A2N6NJT6_BEABA|nr:hypothetical protein BM221_007205 [Beauveria bassiana]